MRYSFVSCIVALMLISCAKKPKPVDIKSAAKQVKLTAEQKVKQQELLRDLLAAVDFKADKLVGRDVKDYSELIALPDKIGSSKTHQYYLFIFGGVPTNGQAYGGEWSRRVEFYVSNGRIIHAEIGGLAEY